MDVTIVIPTKNGGVKFRSVLDAIFKQKTSLSFEVICVDSGSKDETLTIIREFQGVRLYEILPDDFGHGKTRNFGASLGTGNFIVFITQDALPASDYWLDNLVNAVAADPDCAGGFGIHYPYPDCNIFDKRDLKLHFQRFGETNTYFKIDDPEKYKRDEGYRLFLYFYSDNNSCMRRSIWEKYPYDDVNFAEDQLWAAKILELGYHKVYCPTAPVYHSHNFPISTFFCRYFDEFKSLYEIQRFKLVPRFLYLPRFIIVGITRDLHLTFSKELSLSIKEKLYWTMYSIAKNTSRSIAGWLGVKYHLWPVPLQRILDTLFSQQKRQKER